MGHQVYVRAVGTPTSEDDSNVAGVYLVDVDNDVAVEHLGSAALDIFHSDVAVETLDDFEFTVHDADGKIIEVSDSENYEFSDRGSVCSIPTPDGVVFEEAASPMP